LDFFTERLFSSKRLLKGALLDSSATFSPSSSGIANSSPPTSFSSGGLRWQLLTKPARCPRRSSSREVEKELTRKETEAWEVIYLKPYESQTPVIKQALETAALMLGSDKSRGYSGDDLFALSDGSEPDDGDSQLLLHSIRRFYKFLPGDALRLQILRRDAWKCQSCRRAHQLQVHHKEFRSKCGEALRRT
jgi:hypothetical protein